MGSLSHRAALAVLLLPAALFAQTAPPTPAPVPCATPEHRQFDFWVGQWNVVDPEGKPAGSNDVQGILGGCVVQEHWTGSGGETGTSFNIYDAPAKKWHQSWVDSHGLLLLLDGEFQDSKMVLEGKRLNRQGGMVLHRIAPCEVEEDGLSTSFAERPALPRDVAQRGRGCRIPCRQFRFFAARRERQSTPARCCCGR
jgi:hypothetical protein